MAIKSAVDPQNSYNFYKLYMDAIKCLPLRGYYILDKHLEFLTETLAALNSLSMYFLF